MALPAPLPGERHSVVPSPAGDLVLTGVPGADGLTPLTGCWFVGPEFAADPRDGRPRDDAPFAAAAEQLDEYFAGDRRAFDLALQPAGTPFQLAVWAQLRTIPYGETWSYRRLAEAVGSPGASRAVGLANGRNPLAIIVPCHRVIGADGSLTGYAGGMVRKRLLLDLEAGVRTLA